MIQSKNICHVIAYLCAIAISATPASDIRQSPPAESSEPMHLIPVGPHGRIFAESVEELLGNRWGLGTMIYRAGLDADFAISVWKAKTGASFVTYLKLAGDEGATPESSIDVLIGEELALSVHNCWRSMLLDGRYPRKFRALADGWQVEFSAWIEGAGGVYGEANSPTAGPVKELMDCGFALKEYCLAPEGDRRAKRDALILRLKKLADQAERSRDN